ncbi:Mannose-6-phosphate isomerase ManA [termite gut metagenome]|uniref:Mannose-6-phosphate isomerase ManA n=1 Tax=termite gut metagenome TaxID=433724 RepID=A0A5J4RI01_9ZZZZ
MVKQSNYDKFPIVRVTNRAEDCLMGWAAIAEEIKRCVTVIGKEHVTLVTECYQGVLTAELIAAYSRLLPEAAIFVSEAAMRPEAEINALFQEDITDDEVFGFLTRYTIDRFFDGEKTIALRERMAAVDKGIVILVGTGAAHVCPNPDILIYADMARWEIQQRFRRNEIGNIGTDNRNERTSMQYKRAFFVDWRICDRLKKSLMKRWDYVLDTNLPTEPKMITRALFDKGLAEAVSRPFRVVPFFDPGPWGGQWMKEVCDLDPSVDNYAWCFDCVPEENSLLLGFGERQFEIPSIDLVFAHPAPLLGQAVYGRFGDEFPIRFDFLDTIGGGNLSLQVHPLTEYIQSRFGMHYTQDESYYMLDTGDDAIVYLGLKDDIKPQEMIDALQKAQKTGHFNAADFVGVYPVKKHDHILIPAGTVHCSGKNSMVLEISATPFIFTFKLWDWGRLGLDGQPRPINIDHGKRVIQWERTESWVRKELINHTRLIENKEGVREECTGLHEREFIETRRHWFTQPVVHHTDGSVNVLNLVEGKEITVESPSNAFEPFVVHYAETFIVPAAVGDYIVRPNDESEGKLCATIKAFVRHDA